MLLLNTYTMATFKNMFLENILFTKRGENKFKPVLQLESKNNDIILSYLDNDIKREIKLNEKELSEYRFIEKTNNLFHKKHIEIKDPSSLIKETNVIQYSMTRLGSGVYRKISSVTKLDEGIEITFVDNYEDKTLVIENGHLVDYAFLKRTNNKMEFNKIDIIKEMDTGAVGVGGTADSTFSSDFYAPGDARNIFGGNKKPKMAKRPKIEDQITTKRPKKAKKKKKKNGKSKS